MSILSRGHNLTNNEQFSRANEAHSVIYIFGSEDFRVLF